MYGVLNICEIFSRMNVIFRDESNKLSSTIISYNNATVTVSNHLLTMRLKPLLATTHATVP